MQTRTSCEESLALQYLGHIKKSPEDYAKGKHQKRNRYVMRGIAAVVLMDQGTAYIANIQLGVNEDRACKKILPQIPAVLQLMEDHCDLPGFC